MSTSLTSIAFANGEVVPVEHTGDGADASPALRWEGVPRAAKSLALIVTDPDAPRPEPWVHWVLYNLPADVTALPQGVRRELVLPDLGDAKQGRNSWPSDNIGYRGPAPPPGHGAHHYHFRLYALDTMLDLRPGATAEQVRHQMRGHVLDEADLVGTYERPG